MVRSAARGAACRVISGPHAAPLPGVGSGPVAGQESWSDAACGCGSQGAAAEQPGGCSDEESDHRREGETGRGVGGERPGGGAEYPKPGVVEDVAAEGDPEDHDDDGCAERPTNAVTDGEPECSEDAGRTEDQPEQSGTQQRHDRSEERRVGKECSWRE